MAVDEYTDRSKPVHLQLLGKDLVLWHDGKHWRAFEDACPHRGVRLSEFEYFFILHDLVCNLPNNFVVNTQVKVALRRVVSYCAHIMHGVSMAVVNVLPSPKLPTPLKRLRRRR